MKNEIDIPIVAHSIITNGYLFNQEICSYFKDKNLSEIQITLDGNREEHNSTRFAKNDRNTYDTIIKNIDNILRELPDTLLQLRININENNKISFKQIYKEFSDRWKGKNIGIYPGFIRIDNAKKTGLIAPSILDDSRRHFYLDIAEGGVKVNFYPFKESKSCCATHLNSFIIGPQGEFYKCWNDVGKNGRVIGFINDNKLLHPELLEQFLVSGSIFEDTKCRNCFFFPLCSGGCPAQRLKNRYEHGTFNLCITQNDKTKDKQFLNICLEKYYNQIKDKKISGEII